MKKLVVPIALFLIVVLATSALGCDKIKGSGVFNDEYTGEPVDFKVNLVTKSNGKSTEVKGSIHLDDESKGVKVRGGSSMDFYPDDNELVVGGVTVNGTKHTLWFRYNENGNPQSFEIILDDDKGKLAYKWKGLINKVELNKVEWD